MRERRCSLRAAGVAAAVVVAALARRLLQVLVQVEAVRRVVRAVLLRQPAAVAEARHRRRFRLA